MHWIWCCCGERVLWGRCMESIKQMLVREIRGPEGTAADTCDYFMLSVDVDRGVPFTIERAQVVVRVDEQDLAILAEGDLRLPANVARAQARIVDYVNRYAGRVLAGGPAPVSYRTELGSAEVQALRSVDVGRVSIGEWVVVQSPPIVGFVAS
jgi:hypothetical protein